MTAFSRAFRCTLGAAALALLAPIAADAQDLPRAEDIVNRYRQAIGADAFKAKQYMSTVGEFSMPAMGLTAPFEAHAARPNRASSKIPIPGFGEFLRGHTGEHAWAVDPMEGPRILSGEEAKAAADDSWFDSALRPAELVSAMSTVERTTLAGRECYKVKLTWKSGRESHDCYAPDTGLLIGTMMKQTSQMGEIDVVMIYDDYKEFEGVRMATRMTMQVMGNDQVITLREVRFGAVPATAFEPPAEIKALIRQ